MSGLSTLTEMPAQTYAGDTFLLKLPPGGFPASIGWSLEFTFRASVGDAIQSNKIDFASTADGDNHFASVAATATASWVPDDYTGTIRAVKSGDKATIWQGRLKVLSEFKTAQDNTEWRSWAEKCLDNIEAVISGRATRDVLNSTIAGQSIGRLTPEQLFLLRDRFKAELLAEREKEDVANGKPSKSLIGVVFTRP